MKAKNDNFKPELETQYSILIKAENEAEHKRAIIIISLLSITLLVCLLSMIFTYKTLIQNQKKYDTVSEKNETSKILAITYDNSENINFNSTNNKKKIIIKNEGDSPIEFEIKLDNIQTTLTESLSYNVKRNDSLVLTKELPTQSTTIIEKDTIEAQETITYTIEVPVITDSTLTYTGQITINQINNNYSLLE